MTVESEPLFDKAHLESQISAPNAVRMANSFLRDTDGLMDQLSQAIQAHDGASVSQLAHKLTGCCRAILSQKVAKESSALEKLVGLGDWNLIASRAAKLRPLFAQLSDQISAYVKSSS